MFQIGWIFKHSDLVGHLEKCSVSDAFQVIVTRIKAREKKDKGKTNIYSDITK
jgi:hypothetical protein